MPKINIRQIKAQNIHYKNRIDENGNVDIIGVILGQKEQKLLPQYNRVKGEIHKCELYALCLFYYMRCGIQKYSRHGHQKDRVNEFIFDMMMIDEAQILSLSEYRLLKQINKKAKLNLFGDVGQTVTKYGLKSWKKINKFLGDVNYFEYNKNFRNSAEITDYVNKNCSMNLENVGYNSFCVEEINGVDLLEPLLSIDTFENRAIICDLKYRQKMQSLFPQEKVLAVEEVKGIEFNSVYVIEKGMTKNEKYIAYTRALDKLVVVK